MVNPIESAARKILKGGRSKSWLPILAGVVLGVVALYVIGVLVGSPQEPVAKLEPAPAAQAVPVPLPQAQSESVSVFERPVQTVDCAPKRDVYRVEGDTRIINPGGCSLLMFLDGSAGCLVRQDREGRPLPEFCGNQFKDGPVVKRGENREVTHSVRSKDGGAIVLEVLVAPEKMILD